MTIKLSRNRRALPVVAGILAALIVSGCATPDNGRLVARTVSTPFYKVTVNFDSNGCPDSVTPPSQTGCPVAPENGICVKRGRAVQWVSSPAGTPFQVYFDPFVGRPYDSRGPDEKTSPVVVRRDALPGEYKYNVFGVNCSGPNPVLDPAFRVDD